MSTPTTAPNSTIDIPLPAWGDSLTFRSQSITVESGNGRVVMQKAKVQRAGPSATIEFCKALKTGDVINEGPNKAWIYCEEHLVDPFLVAPKDIEVVDREAAMAYPATHDANLPTDKPLNALYAARNAGAFKDSLNIHGLYPDGWYWSSNPNRLLTTLVRQLSRNATSAPAFKNDRANLRPVRPYMPA